jgi:phosphatidylglycerol---prolipoprotein diacylglyceryl transferase
VIPDSHQALLGLRPVLFHVGGFAVTSYAVFMILGVAAALLCYRWQAGRLGLVGQHSWAIILGALLFGSLGAKLLNLAVHANQFHSLGLNQFLYGGRSIIGGLIGGWLGVRLVKQRLGIHTRNGNAIAPAAALGLAVGRIGCLLGSCCCGTVTTCPWGVDFGDGQRRHPTQIYEALFAVGLFVYFIRANRRPQVPGALFKRFLVAYFAFRFLVEFIRLEPKCCWGLTAFQVLSLAVLGVLFSSWAWRRATGRTACEVACRDGSG